MNNPKLAVVLAVFFVAGACTRPHAPEMVASFIDTDVAAAAVPAEKSTFALKVLSDGYWEVVAPEWISAKPASGYGDNRLVLTFSRNGEEGKVTFAPQREDVVILKGKAVEKTIPVLQGGEIALKDFLDKDDNPAVFWQVTGTVRSVEDADYGRLTLADETGEIAVFNVLDGEKRNRQFGRMNILPGDAVTLYGYKSTFEEHEYLFDAQVLQVDFDGFYLSEGKVSAPHGGTAIDISIFDGSGVEITSEAEWIHTGELHQADGHQAVTITVDANPVYDKRSASVLFKAGAKTRSVLVSQDAHPVYRFLLENKSEAVSKNAGSTSVTIHANSALRWKAVPSEGLVLDRREGVGSATVTVSYPDNPSAGTHLHTVTFSTENEFAEQKELVFSIEQEARLYAKWLFDTDNCVDFQYAFGVKTLGTYTRDLNAGDGGLYAPANRGDGRITYVQIDKHGLSGAEGVSGRTVDKNGKLLITGGYKGDYWLFEIGDGKTVIPAGTRIRARFWTATSAGGMSLTLTEYSDSEGASWAVPKTWNTDPQKHTLRTASSGSTLDTAQGVFPSLNAADNGVRFNSVQEGAAALLPLDFTVTTARDLTRFLVRVTTAAALNTNYADMTDRTNSGTFRITGEHATFEIVEQ